jgi:hypothetical protein
MAFVHSPKVVTDGLVLALDAGNTKSYASGSTTWLDKSGFGNNGTLINGPTFNSANGGSIVFDGVDDYTGNFPIQISGTGSKTVGTWFNINTTSRAGLCGTRPFLGSYGWVFTVNRTTPGNLTYFHTGGSIIEQAAGITTNKWYHGCLTYNTSTLTAALYLNGTVIASLGSFTPSSVSSVNGFVGCEQESSVEFFKGSIASTQIYNRALSAQEVLQNYNATKGRFGL